MIVREYIAALEKLPQDMEVNRRDYNHGFIEPPLPCVVEIVNGGFDDDPWWTLNGEWNQRNSGEKNVVRIG